MDFVTWAEARHHAPPGRPAYACGDGDGVDCE